MIKDYHFYIWFRQPEMDFINNTNDPALLLIKNILDDTRGMISIIGFDFSADQVEKTLQDDPAKVLEGIYQLFLPTTPKTLSWIIELQKTNPLLKIITGNRIFIRELNQCWECTKDSWKLVDTKGTVI